MALTPLWRGFEYKAHQITGINWMLSRNGGLLCDEMGLGKTIQIAGLLKNGSNDGKASLLVAPVAVLEQWASIAKKSGIDVARPLSRGKGWARTASTGLTTLFMVGYEMAARNPRLLSAFAWDRVIWDEAHRLASGNKSTEVAMSVKAGAKWLLTGTPIVNKIKDLTNLMSVVGIEISNLDEAAPILKERILARTMDQLRASMPDAPPKPVFHTERLDFATEDEAEFYKCMTGAIRKRWSAIEADGNALEKLKLFMRLRQLSLHPQVYIAGRKKALGALYKRDDWVGDSTKFNAIKKLVAEGGRWIIFCHFHTEMDMLKELLQPVVEKVQIYSGALTASEKEAVLEATHGSGSEVLLVQLQSGGTGLNLQHFDKIMFTGPWWTKALMDQAVGRAVRIGQRNVVQVYNIVLKDEEALNIDTYMTERAAEKGALCEKVLSFAKSDV